MEEEEQGPEQRPVDRAAALSCGFLLEIGELREPSGVPIGFDRCPVELRRQGKPFCKTGCEVCGQGSCWKEFYRATGMRASEWP